MNIKLELVATDGTKTGFTEEELISYTLDYVNQMYVVKYIADDKNVTMTLPLCNLFAINVVD